MIIADEEDYSFEFSAKWSQVVAKQGFTQIPNALLRSRKQLGVTTTELYILIVLESFRYDNWRAPYPSLQLLSEITGLHRQTIYRATAKLETLELIEKYRRYNSSSVYDLRPVGQRLDQLAVNAGDYSL